MLGRLLTFVLPGIILVFGLVACSSSEEEKPTPAPPPTSQPTSPPAAPAQSTQAGGDVFVVTNEDPGGSGRYKFNPNELKFKVGQTVTLRLTAESEFHTFTVEELGLDEALNAGETRDVSFTFDRAGSFKLVCIPHASLGMVGTIVVD